ncbi:PucR family transcriptional regulator ligand-binding domain-containing protein [Paenibacillus sp. JX-17]|uniref:PucR family transcriptional regulator ligand-binding domain-containing protein n=1 Tax=Paenibacillus lacisoli TaxID=3064525 RepID=A0ABT9CAL5_9BACL|nr:PucR family transcriptional regulator [Paenibacillus sp. JX-17]MDO7905588.1 PucR family transcriptional regulator ligand-binding domain-containing protein [Paenibacillus sp. JX-17]
MHLTVKDALQIYPLSEAKLVAGVQGTTRTMKSVNVIDAPDIADWTRSGEMLFTTGFAMKDNPGEARQLMRKLNDKGCAGLGIKLGRFWERIPSAFLEEADRLQLPLLELPFQFTFSDQMNALFRAEHERSTRVLQSVLERQKQLMQFALQSRRHDNVFAELEQILANPVVIVGSRGHVLYDPNSCTEQAGLLSGWPWKSAYTRVKWNSGSCHRIHIQRNEELLGSLLVFTEGGLPLRPEEELFRQAADVLAFTMDLSGRHQALSNVQEEVQQLVARYLERKMSFGELVSFTDKLGLNWLAGPYQCVLTTVEGSGLSRENQLDHLFRELHFNPHLQLGPALHFQMEQGILSLYASLDQRDAGDVLECLFRDNAAELAKPGDGSGPRFWISRLKLEPESLREAYEECQDTRCLAIRFGMKDPVLQFQALEFAYLFQHVPDHVMRTYCEKVLEPLSYDSQSNPMLMQTLEAYIDNDGLINEAAKQLYVHRNTVAYRMEKISSLLQMDFKKTNDLLKLKIVFTFMNFLRKGGQKEIKEK